MAVSNGPKNIAITDLEFTGLDPTRHEIIEVGLIVVESETLIEKGRFETKVKPEHIENADTESLAVAGYEESLWRNALPLSDALRQYLDLAGNALFAAWCTPYDWIFLLEAFKKTGIKNPLGHRTIDIFTVAYEKLKNNPDVTRMGLSGLCKYFDIPPESMPHHAATGAQKAFEVYKKLRALP